LAELRGIQEAINVNIRYVGDFTKSTGYLTIYNIIAERIEKFPYNPF